MSSHFHSRAIRGIACIGLTVITLAGNPAAAQTYISAEPIPSGDIVGTAKLNKILNLGYSDLELWSQRLLSDCHMVQNVIHTLSDNRAIRTIYPGNTRYKVAAGGFEGVTDPTFVVTIDDSGPASASDSDIFVLNNALGYVLNQSGTAQFTIPFDKRNSFEFALDYAAITFGGSLSGEHAKSFFDYLGTIDPKLWSGENAGFTQVNLSNNPVDRFLLDDSMLFLIGSVPKEEFIEGLSKAANNTRNTTYSPLMKNGKPTTAQAGAAFPGNDWVASPGGDGYLSNLGSTSPQLLKSLANLRQQHLQAVNALLTAIDKGTVNRFLNSQFRCQ